MTSIFTVRLDPDSLARLTAFDDYQEVLEPALSNAMEASIAVLQSNASDYMWSTFENPTGTVEDDSWDVDMVGPYESILENTAPYSQRLQYGFSGKTDALGRFFLYWPFGEYEDGYHWAEAAIRASRGRVRDLFQAAVDYSNTQLAGGSTP